MTLFCTGIRGRRCEDGAMSDDRYAALLAERNTGTEVNK
jgi:hypothetical protein